MENVKIITQSDVLEKVANALRGEVLAIDLDVTASMSPSMATAAEAMITALEKAADAIDALPRPLQEADVRQILKAPYLYPLIGRIPLDVECSMCKKLGMPKAFAMKTAKATIQVCFDCIRALMHKIEKEGDK